MLQKKVSKKFIEKLLENRNLEKFNIRFKPRNNLIYYILRNNRERLYIPYFFKKKIFHIIYNLSDHNNFYKTYNRLSIFIYI